ncbi:MAG: serine/threonine protein kinase, partial [Verrucomicrobiales bacterium]|nr:serine/threonine protein kinase [Verrucomicrobiales bacterium]
MAHDPFLAQSQDQGGPAVPQLQPGQLLFNRRYELKQLLGAGGMGVVWLAMDHTEEIEVALKFLPSVLVLQEREMQRLREEVRAGKELRHPRLVGTYGMEAADGLAAIVMEYVPGQTLQQRLESVPQGFFEPDQITDWVTDICDGLVYLHGEARRVHRDLKPANVIVDLQGRARLMDFGISHRIKEGVTRHTKAAEVQAATTSSNTLAYASPQQLDGKPSIAADDIYGLGALIYELLTSTPPFFRGSAEVVAMQIRTAELTPMTDRREELLGEGIIASVGHAVSGTWETCVAGCLQKDREQRFSLTQVRSCLSGAPTSFPASKRSSKALLLAVFL